MVIAVWLNCGAGVARGRRFPAALRARAAADRRSRRPGTTKARVTHVPSVVTQLLSASTCLSPWEMTLPMSKGTSAPPEMAMHIRPLSSLAHSGFSSTVMEKSIGQMLANPRPPQTIPANANSLTRVIIKHQASQPQESGEPEEGVSADLDASRHDATHRQRAEKQNRTGPGCRIRRESKALQRGLEKRAHADLRADIEENAQHRESKHRFTQKSQRASHTGRHVGFGFLHLERGHRDKRQRHQHEEDGEHSAPSHFLQAPGGRPAKSRR